MKILTHRWHRVLTISLLTLLSIVLVLAFIVNAYWSPILAKKVRNVVYTSSNGLYTISFSRADLHVLRGEIDMYDIVLKPDTAVYNRRKAAHLAPNNLIELHVKRLVLTHTHPIKLYFERKLDIGRIILSEPELKVSYQLNHVKDTLIKDRRTLYERISKSLKSISVNKISLNDVKFKYEDYSGNKVAISELKEMNLTATDLLIDSNSKNDRSRLFYCRDIVTELNNYTGHTPSGLYSYKVNYLRLSTHTSKLTMRGLDLQPIRADVFFDKSMHDRFRVHLDSLELSHFDFLSYHKYRILNASRLLLNHGSINVFNRPNKPKPDAVTDKIKTFPNYALKELKDDIRIDTIHIKDIDVSYTEFKDQSNKTGTIFFNHTDGTFLNITTNKKALLKNNICTVQVSSYFMNASPLTASFKFNLTDDNAAFSYKGHLGTMNLQRLNPAIMPLALVKISSGKLTSLDFDMKSGSRRSTGKLTMLYNDLKVTLLKADTVNNQFKHKTLLSLFANALIIKRDNPEKTGEQPKTIPVIFDRPKDYPFFKTIWHTLLGGIKPTIGLDDETQKKVKAQINVQAKDKQDRMSRKAERKQRREERKLKRALKKEQNAQNHQ